MGRGQNVSWNFNNEYEYSCVSQKKEKGELTLRKGYICFCFWPVCSGSRLPQDEALKEERAKCEEVSQMVSEFISQLPVACMEEPSSACHPTEDLEDLENPQPSKRKADKVSVW